IDRVTVAGSAGVGVACAAGRSSLIDCVNSGAARMKITSSTSITSTIGVTLISAIGAGRLLSLNPPKLMAASPNELFIYRRARRWSDGRADRAQRHRAPPA